MTLKHEIRKVIRRVGYDISSYRPDTHHLARRQHLLRRYDIDTVLDVGANTGQYAIELREDLKFAGNIVSFEPMGAEFKVLQQKARRDRKWKTFNYALGDEDGMSEINVAGNSYSSSMLEMLPAHVKAAPDSVYVGQEKIVVRKLDSMIDSVCSVDDNIYLKMDVQGFERRVLLGAEQSLRRIRTIQLEMSLRPLYEGELPFGEMHGVLLAKGFQLVSLEQGFADVETGHLLQIDGVYRRD